MNYHKIIIDISDLESYDIPSSSNPYILTINSSGVKFEFLIKNIIEAKNILIMGSGSYDTNKMTPPIFQRHAWIEDFDETVIIYNDPTLYLGKITLGWGNGTEERYYLKEVSEIIKVLLLKLEYKNDETFFYGSSAGGYMSMILAGFNKGSTAIVNNPQTIVANFWPNLVREMIEVSYPNLSLNQVINQFPARMNIIEFFKEINYIPPINYLQNIAATRDVEKHFIPFVSGINELVQNISSEQIKVELYSDKEKGHTPVSKSETIKYINKIINKK